jgi:hypothetical protein
MPLVPYGQMIILTFFDNANNFTKMLLIKREGGKW